MYQGLQAVGIRLQPCQEIRVSWFVCVCLRFVRQSLFNAHRSTDVVFHPFTLLFYVSNLCFTCSRMARLFKVIMTEREVKLRAVFAWCMACEWSVADLYFLFSKIYYVISYRKAWTDASTPEQTSLAAWSRDEAIKDLHAFMKVRCFPDEIRMAVVWLYNH